MSMPKGWKWKLFLVLLAFAMFCMAFILTPTGQGWIISHIDSAFDEMPEEQRRDSAWADRYLNLAWFKANINGDYEGATHMYKDFCGTLTDKEDNAVYTDIREDYFNNHKLHGKCSPDGKTGWGPMHPRAPEAFYAFLTLYWERNSAQFTAVECKKYYDLFYVWMEKHSPDHKPHPLFNKYWPKVLGMMSNIGKKFPQTVNEKAPDAAPYTEPK